MPRGGKASSTSAPTSVGDASGGATTGAAAGADTAGRSHPCAAASACRCGSCRRGTDSSTHTLLAAISVTAATHSPRKLAPPLSLLRRWRQRGGQQRM